MLASKRILIVDDNADSGAALAARVRAAGCEVAAVVRPGDGATERGVADLPSAVLVTLAAVGRDRSAVEKFRRGFAMPVFFVVADQAAAYAAGLEEGEYTKVGADGRDFQLMFSLGFQRSGFEQRMQELEGRLGEAQRYEDLGRMAGNVAHKFNNLLMGITSGAALVRFDLPEISPGHEHLDRIDETVRQAAELCQQLLASVRRENEAQRGSATVSSAADVPAPLKISPKYTGGIQGAVLIVDDDDGVRALARWVVEKAGFSAVTARDGDDALARFRADPGAYGLVLLDLTMPRMSGEEVLVALRSIRPNIPVVVITGYGEEAVSEGERNGIAGFLQKPFSPDALRAVLQRCATAPAKK